MTDSSGMAGGGLVILTTMISIPLLVAAICIWRRLVRAGAAGVLALIMWLPALVSVMILPVAAAIYWISMRSTGRNIRPSTKCMST